uniref:Glycoside hydrolase 15-related protein n=1 Tax=Moorella thermoacetica (strain ATCC 39073 / JCM 9320) TaxID=264732 RepID=Q2RKR0_MOOTA
MRDILKHRPYYGFIGNGETAALVAPDFAITWLCVPRFDSFPLFAAALSPERGGSLRLDIEPAVNPVSQRYLPDSNVLETVGRGQGLQVTVLDFMPWGYHHLTRLIILENTGVDTLKPRVRWQASPIITGAHTFKVQSRGSFQFIYGPGGAACIGMAGAPGPTSTLTLKPGEKHRLWLVLAYGTNLTLARQHWTVGFYSSLEENLAWWRRWFKKARRPNTTSAEVMEAYYRSLMVLKLLTYERTGAIIAAPTTSFPAVPGGNDNWDYRYCWLRDGYFTALAFDAAGYHEEARSFYDFALSLQQPDGGWYMPLVPVEGRGGKEYIAADLAGPHGEKPIRFGNAAMHQIQLDNAGNVLDGLWNHYLATRDREYIRSRWDAIRRAALWLENYWDRPENGIWEIRERKDHWLYGKILCYAGLTAASHLSIEMGRLQWAGRWHRAASRVRRQLLIQGWSAERQAYLQHYGPDAPLDISVLALEFYGLLAANHPRLLKTVAAIEQPSPVAKGEPATRGGLNMWGGIARFEQAAIPFYLPTLWLGRYYLHAGNYERARELLQVCLDNATDLYLMAEHFDPRTGEQWGNFPQGFSHQEIVRFLLDYAYRED